MQVNNDFYYGYQPDSHDQPLKQQLMINQTILQYLLNLFMERDSQQSDSFEQDSSIDQQNLLQTQEKRIKEQLKQIPYGEILKYQQQNKNHHSAILSQKKKPTVSQNKHQTPQPSSQSNTPKEIKIMKVPPKKKFKPIFEREQRVSIDPRFEAYAGNYNPDLAAKTYSFIAQKQKQEAQELKKKIHTPKTKQQERDILIKHYNQITSDIRKNQISDIQRKVKSKYKDKKFKPKKRELKSEIQKEKLANMSAKDQDKRLKKMQKKIKKQNIIQRKRLNLVPRPN